MVISRSINAVIENTHRSRLNNNTSQLISFFSMQQFLLADCDPSFGHEQLNIFSARKWSLICEIKMCHVMPVHLKDYERIREFKKGNCAINLDFYSTIHHNWRLGLFLV